MSDSRPIGVFDSGIGGLTVVRELMHLLPNEPILYFGDTARVPYGTKSAKVVRFFAHQDTRFLVRQNVKVVIAACHTASSVALDDLSRSFDVPVLGVIEPGVEAALKATRNNRIGVVGTRGTVLSGTYEKKLKERREGLYVETRACPLFVPLVEEGWLDGDVARSVVAIYLEPFKDKDIDTLILGCTHYPLLKPVIGEFLGEGICLIDSAEETAGTMRNCLMERGLEHPGLEAPLNRFYVSDSSHHFKKMGEQFLGRKLDSVENVELESIETNF
ncbi:MAG TPA: glutamate racemase [bacterium]